MKKISIILLLSIFCITGILYAGKYPKPVGWVNDFAVVIEPLYNDKISAVINELKEKTSSEISVVTLKTLNGDSIEKVSTEIFESYGIGKKGKDNGILIIASIEDKKVRIEVGYGLEGVLPDGVVGGILDSYVLPEFKKSEYGKGLYLGTMAVAYTIAKEQGVQLTGGSTAPEKEQNAKPSLLKIVFNLILLIFLAVVFINNPMLFLLFLGMGGGRGGGGGGGFGGGFGGFGGGMSGGGGSSRGW
jgi:uncharacterized protein